MYVHPMLANITPGCRQHAFPKTCFAHPSSKGHIQMSLLCGRKDSGWKLFPGMVAFPQAALSELVKFTELCWGEEERGGCE